MSNSCCKILRLFREMLEGTLVRIAQNKTYSRVGWWLSFMAVRCNSCCNCDGLRTRAAISGGKWIEMVCFLVVKRKVFWSCLGWNPAGSILFWKYFFLKQVADKKTDEKLKHLTNQRLNLYSNMCLCWCQFLSLSFFWLQVDLLPVSSGAHTLDFVLLGSNSWDSQEYSQTLLLLGTSGLWIQSVVSRCFKKRVSMMFISWSV